jgi:uncharacterized zinc-type alcohol dehydrogenase-like protein
MEMGAHEVIRSGDPTSMRAAAGTFDFILSTVNVALDWQAYLALLRPDGALHFVGAVRQPISVAAASLIGGRKRLSGSPVGSPAEIMVMLEFCERHGIRPRIEQFSMSEVNEALKYLRSGKARYRLVLQAPATPND